MATFEIENQGTSTYLSYALNPQDEKDELSFGMLANNRIEGIAPIVYSQLNNERFFKYDISSKIPAKKFFSGSVTKKKVITFLLGIISAIMTSEEYMVDSSLFVLDLNYIFVDMVTYKPILICVPILNAQEPAETVNNFIRRLIFSIRYDQTENCDYVTKIINYVNGSPNFSISDFKKTLDEIDISSPVVAQAPVQQPAQTSPYRPQSGYGQQKPIIESTSDRPNMQPPISPPSNIPKKPTDKRYPVEPHSEQKGRGVPQIKKPEKSKNDNPKENKKTNNKPADTNQQKMSIFYLLRNYNKENLEIFKAQKNGGGAAPVSKTPVAPKTKGKPAGKGSRSGFAMPGHDQGFAMPGRETEYSTPEPSTPENPAVPQVETPRQPTPPVSSVPLGGFSHPPRPNVVDADFGDTTILVAPNAASGETTILGPNVHANTNVTAYLVRKRTGTKTVINKANFRIGKERSSSDLFIDDNAAISRNHALIIKQNTTFFLEDNNSTNHTYLNGMMLAGGDKAKLKSGDRITLANEEFDFIVEI